MNNVSHEFRTPLTVIKEYVATLHETLAGNLETEVRQFFDVIHNRVEDLNVMVNDLLDISRLEADIMRMSRRTIHPQEIVQRIQLTLERKAARSGVNFEVEFPSREPAAAQ